MPIILILDPSNVTIDGQPAGALVDLIANHANDPADAAHAAFRAALHDALVTWHEANRQATEKTLADAHAEFQAQHAKAMTARNAKYEADLQLHVDTHAEALAKAHDEAAKHRAIAGDLRGQVDALGGTELAIKLKRENRCDHLRERIAEATKELAEHEGA